MSRPPELDRNQDATCYVGNLDDRCTDALVWELMIQAGPLVHLHLPKDRITQTHQGYAFAEFQTEADADYACKVMNGLKLYGKPIRVNKASSDKKQIDIGANLFVGNLDANVDERALYDAFSTFGQIVGVPKVARDPATGVSKNFGFVSFDSFEAADAAIESLNNQFLLNRPITVTYAIKKDSKTGERHGTAAERLLAAQARKNNALPPPPPMMRPPPPGSFGGAPPGAAPAPWGGFATGANAGAVGPGPGYAAAQQQHSQAQQHQQQQQPYHMDGQGVRPGMPPPPPGGAMAPPGGMPPGGMGPPPMHMGMQGGPPPQQQQHAMQNGGSPLPPPPIPGAPPHQIPPHGQPYGGQAQPPRW
ncbi:Spliceosome-associated protein 49 [Thecaphora frezii]